MKRWAKKGAMGIMMALLVILSIDGFLFMGQMAVSDVSTEMGIAETNKTVFLNYDDSFISTWDRGNYTLTTNGSADELLGTDSEVNPETGDIFTDTFAKVKSWFTKIGTGATIFLEVLGGPYRYLLMAGTPAWFTYTVAVIWYGLTLALFIAFIAGRSND